MRPSVLSTTMRVAYATAGDSTTITSHCLPMPRVTCLQHARSLSMRGLARVAACNETHEKMSCDAAVNSSCVR